MFPTCRSPGEKRFGRRVLAGGAALALLAAGLGAGAPLTDVNGAFPRGAGPGPQVLPPLTDANGQIFFHEAGQLNLLETRLGEIALQRSSLPAVQDYARRMIAEHSRLHQELTNLAVQVRFTVPAHLDAPGTQTVNRFAALTGADFDRAYLDTSVSDHEAAIAAFQSIAEGTATSGTPLTPVVDWARRTMPLLNQQLALGQTTAQILKMRETAGGM